MRSIGQAPLASAIFAAESPFGWQEALLPTPVAIDADTTYVVSVNSNTNYVATVVSVAAFIGTRPTIRTRGRDLDTGLAAQRWHRVDWAGPTESVREPPPQIRV